MRRYDESSEDLSRTHLVDDKHSPIPATAVQATLYVKATAILGGIDIKN